VFVSVSVCLFLCFCVNIIQSGVQRTI
jgi:hypothetical protein